MQNSHFANNQNSCFCFNLVDGCVIIQKSYKKFSKIQHHSHNVFAILC